MCNLIEIISNEQIRWSKGSNQLVNWLQSVDHMAVCSLKLKCFSFHSTITMQSIEFHRAMNDGLMLCQLVFMANFELLEITTLTRIIS
jgi:hypothetical protein